MNIDLMIDCMPYNGFDDKLYEMLEDDMKIIANLNCSSSSSSSPSCLSDEEQLAFSSSNNFDDLFIFPNLPTSSTSNTTTVNAVNSSVYAASSNNNNHVNNNQDSITCPLANNFTNQTLDDTYNSIMNLNNSYNSYSFQSSCSSSPHSSASTSATSSSAPSPLSLSSSSSSLCAALASASFQTRSSASACSSSLSSPICLSPNQYNPTNSINNFQLDNYNQQNTNLDSNGQSASTTAQIQDSYLNNNYNVYQVINPMDINRNYTTTSENIISQSHVLNTKTISISNSNCNNNSLQIPLCRSNNQTSLNINNKTLNSNNLNQQIKRGKFTHNSNNNNSNQIINLGIKQESIMNSDGESIISNESDSNSNFSNSSTGTNSNNSNNKNNNTNFSINNNNNSSTEFQSKKVIITTKLEPFFNINTANTSNNNNNQSQNSTTSSSSSLQLLNVNNTQINVIKIANPKDSNLDSNKTTTNALQLPLSSSTTINKLTDSNSQNHKTIIQYKQLINPSSTTAPAATTVNNPSTAAVVKQTIKNRQNSNSISTNSGNNNQNANAPQVVLRSDGKAYPKPPYSYSCLIAMALRNSDSGTLPVSDIYEFIIENFPYYKTARDGWKNSIRHNLSLNKCFEKIENPTNGSKKGCLWALNPDKCKKLEEECKRCRQRDPVNIRLSMSRPDDLNKIERGEQRIKKYTAQRKLMENGVINTNNNNNNTQLQQSNNNQILSNDLILSWSNKNTLSNTNIKEEESDHYFDELGNSDIKFDPILLSTVSPSVRTNI